ncbi:hypothetical protein [Ensifer adhaerens]|uniref:hypothetical protein n=1 Tax=Ensifer adhaerens TaxID=106592 RepID=UPI000A50E45D|nr:hypothetical protein [Ensifer adhaerens]
MGEIRRGRYMGSRSYETGFALEPPIASPARSGITPEYAETVFRVIVESDKKVV